MNSPSLIPLFSYRVLRWVGKRIIRGIDDLAFLGAETIGFLVLVEFAEEDIKGRQLLPTHRGTGKWWLHQEPGSSSAIMI